MKKDWEHFRTLTENVTEFAFYRMSIPEGKYDYVSPASSILFGYSPEEFYKNPLLIRDIIHPDWYGYFESEWENLIKGEVPTTYEYQIIHKDKRVRWIKQHNTIEKDENGTIRAIEGLVTDITDKKNAEEALVNSKAQLRLLLDTLPDLVWLKDPEGVYLSCNRKFERFFGAQESEIIGRTDYDFVDKEIADFFRINDQRAIKMNAPSVNEEVLTFSDDNYHGIFETIKTPMRDPAGKLIGVLGIARDITERKRIEDDLLRNEQRYKSAQRIGLVGNWEYDLASETFWGSNQAKHIFGFDQNVESLTTDDVESCIVERERVHQALINLIEKNKPYNIEYEIHPISGSKTKVLRSVAEVTKDKKGNPIKVIGVIQDITSHKDAEKERKKLESQLRQAHKMESIGTLAGGIAHDFNNILTSILGFSEIALLDEVEKNTTVKQYLKQIHAGGLRAKELVRQILAFARQSDEEVKPTRVDTVITEALKLIRSSTPSTIKIKKKIHSTSLIMGNATQIHQIILNLCTNAIHAMEGAGGVMEVTLKDVIFDEASNSKPAGLGKEKFIELTISDTGCGIKPEEMDFIFDPYFTTKETGQGTGMGLAMVRGIVESYGGSITVKSTPLKGTIFNIYLPITSNLEYEHFTQIESLPKGDEHILFVDDELQITLMGRSILESLGYQVTTRTSSVEALELFKKRPDDFQLIIADMTMPNMTGDRFAIELKQIRADISIILCTGYSNKINSEIAQEIGIDAFVYKPLSIVDLANIVKEVLS